MFCHDAMVSRAQCQRCMRRGKLPLAAQHRSAHPLDALQDLLKLVGIPVVPLALKGVLAEQHHVQHHARRPDCSRHRRSAVHVEEGADCMHQRPECTLPVPVRCSKGQLRASPSTDLPS